MSDMHENMFKINSVSSSDLFLDPGKELPGLVGVFYNTDIRVMGYVDKIGCYSYLQSLDNTIDVALYDATPSEVMGSNPPEAMYVTLSNVEGWGFIAITLLRGMLAVRREDCPDIVSHSIKGAKDCKADFGDNYDMYVKYIGSWHKEDGTVIVPLSYEMYMSLDIDS